MSLPFLLYVSASQGNIDVVKELLYGEDRIHPNSPKAVIFGASPLHVAAAEGHLEICKMLVNATEISEDISYKKGYLITKVDETPLHWAYRSLRLYEDELKAFRFDPKRFPELRLKVENIQKVIDYLKDGIIHESLVSKFTGTAKDCYNRPNHNANTIVKCQHLKK